MQVARLGHADRGMQQDICLCLLGRLQSDLTMHAVHRFTGMKADDILPAHLDKQMTQFLWCVTQGFEIVVNRQLHTGDRSA